MERGELAVALRALGLDEQTARLLVLLPLVQVAWADGGVQHNERTLILDLARDGLRLDRRSLERLDAWLQVAPPSDVMERGRALLVSLVATPGAPPVGLPADALSALPILCMRVAEAAGGLFGWAAVDPREAAVLADLAAAVAQGRSNLRALLPIPPEGLRDLPTVD